MTQINTKQIIKLANLSVSDEDELLSTIDSELESTIDYVSQIQTVKTNDISETHQVTGLENVFRKDEIEPERILTQKQALSNSKNTHQGYIVVKAVIET